MKHFIIFSYQSPDVWSWKYNKMWPFRIPIPYNSADPSSTSSSSANPTVRSPEVTPLNKSVIFCKLFLTSTLCLALLVATCNGVFPSWFSKRGSAPCFIKSAIISTAPIAAAPCKHVEFNLFGVVTDAPCSWRKGGGYVNMWSGPK